MKLGLERLQSHAFPEQFLPVMDYPDRDWAERFLLIASTPRFGSHFLGHMLGATGHCGVPLEYFNQGNQAHWEDRFKKTGMEALFPEFVRHRTSPNGTFTLKTHWHQYAPHIPTIDSMTRGISFNKVIWIARKNQLSQAISHVVAMQTGVWISGAKPKGKAYFDYDAIVKSAHTTRESNLKWRNYVNALPSEQAMSLLYEDLLSNPSVRDNVAAFLGLDATLKPSERTHKQGGERNAAWKKRFAEEVREEDRWILEPPDWLV